MKKRTNKVPKTRTTLKKVRAVIQSVLPPEATEVIRYPIPCVTYKGMLMGYAAFREHCSLFGMSGTLLGPLKKDLKKYPTSKGTIRFPVDKPLPSALIRKLVKAAIAERELRPPRATKPAHGHVRLESTRRIKETAWRHAEETREKVAISSQKQTP